MALKSIYMGTEDRT